MDAAKWEELVCCSEADTVLLRRTDGEDVRTFLIFYGMIRTEKGEQQGAIGKEGVKVCPFCLTPTAEAATRPPVLGTAALQQVQQIDRTLLRSKKNAPKG